MSLFLYIHSDNPQERLIKQAVAILEDGGVIVYPTDSGYALGCTLNNKQATDRIINIRKLPENHNFTLMCRDLADISNYAMVNNDQYRILKNNTPGRYTFILTASKELPRRVMKSKRKTIGIRIPDNKIALALLAELGQPMLSCSLMLPDEDITQSDPEEIRDILDKHVDLIIHGGYLGQKPTTVIDLSHTGIVSIVREGSGDTTPFE